MAAVLYSPACARIAPAVAIWPRDTAASLEKHFFAIPALLDGYRITSEA